MKNKLIVDNELKKLENDLYIENLKKKEKELSLRLENLKRGKDDSSYKELLGKIRSSKNYLLGLLFLRKSIKESLKKIESNYYSLLEGERKRLVTSLEKDLEINRREIDNKHLEYKKLLDEKDKYALKIDKKRKELEEILWKVRQQREEYPQEKFVNELIKVFRNNDFGKMYDSWNEDLGYSLGQIFIIKYALTNLVRYLDKEDITLSMASQLRLLKEYDFKEQKKSLSGNDFINNLRMGNVFNCSLDYPVLSYKESLRLYKQVCKTFHLPRIIVCRVRKKL